jgi:hypothetical protein
MSLYGFPALAFCRDISFAPDFPSLSEVLSLPLADVPSDAAPFPSFLIILRLQEIY